MKVFVNGELFPGHQIDPQTINLYGFGGDERRPLVFLNGQLQSPDDVTWTGPNVIRFTDWNLEDTDVVCVEVMMK